jgi:hypothetical protein
MFSKLFVIKLAGAAAATVVATAGMATATTTTPGQVAAKQLAQAKALNTKYQIPATARKAGYGLLKDAKGIACISDSMGGMGVHLVNGALVGDATVKANSPEALVYEPGADGKLHLVAAEYVVFAAKWDAKHKTPPKLFGHTLALVPAGNRYGLPAFYEIHTWSWKHNPMGTFMDYNPSVTCAHSTELYR